MICDMCAETLRKKPYLAIIDEVHVQTCSAACYTRLCKVWEVKFPMLFWRKAEMIIATVLGKF
jgi:hypothetical protein